MVCRPNIVFISGTNGSGKTAVMNAIQVQPRSHQAEQVQFWKSQMLSSNVCNLRRCAWVQQRARQAVPAAPPHSCAPAAQQLWLPSPSGIQVPSECIGAGMSCCVVDTAAAGLVCCCASGSGPAC